MNKKLYIPNWIKIVLYTMLKIFDDRSKRFIYSDHFQASLIFICFFIFYYAIKNPNQDLGSIGLNSIGLLKYHTTINSVWAPHHILHHIVNGLSCDIGTYFGYSLLQSSMANILFFSSLNMSLLFLWLKNNNISTKISIIATILVGTTPTILEMSTVVDTYSLSFFTVLLSLHSLTNYLKDQSRKNEILLFVANLLLFLSNIGFSFFILSLYIYLTFKYQKKYRYIVSGIFVVVCYYLIAYINIGMVFGITGLTKIKEINNFGYFNMHFNSQFPAQRVITSFWLLIGIHLGILFPFIVYIKEVKKDYYYLFVINSIIFYLFYIFWPPDNGAFFIPIFPFFALCFANIIDKIKFHYTAIIFLIIYSFCFMLYPYSISNVRFFINYNDEIIFYSFVFIIVMHILFCIKNKNIHNHISNNKKICIAGVILISLNSLSFLPKFIQYSIPNERTLFLRELYEIIDNGDIFVSAEILFPTTKTNKKIISFCTKNTPDPRLKYIFGGQYLPIRSFYFEFINLFDKQILLSNKKIYSDEISLALCLYFIYWKYPEIKLYYDRILIKNKWMYVVSADHVYENFKK